jgi:hypothetical protein
MEVWGRNSAFGNCGTKMGQPDKTSKIVSTEARTTDWCSVEDNKQIPQINSG